VDVINAAPNVNVDVNFQGMEGATVNFVSSAIDPAGASDIVTYQWQVLDALDQVIEESSTADFSFTPADDGTYTVTLTVTDEDGGSSYNEFPFTVSNIAPTLLISGDSFVPEGVTYYLSLSATDPGADTIQSWSVNWGDGSVDMLPGDTTVATHQYVPLTFIADIDGDGDVDGTDVVVFSNNYGQTGVGLAGDFDADGDVDDADLEVFSANFGVIGYDAYNVSATATDEDGTYSSNTIQVVDPPVAKPAEDTTPAPVEEVGVNPAPVEPPLVVADPLPVEEPVEVAEPLPTAQPVEAEKILVNNASEKAAHGQLLAQQSGNKNGMKGSVTPEPKLTTSDLVQLSKSGILPEIPGLPFSSSPEDTLFANNLPERFAGSFGEETSNSNRDDQAVSLIDWSGSGRDSGQSRRDAHHLKKSRTVSGQWAGNFVNNLRESDVTDDPNSDIMVKLSGKNDAVQRNTLFSKLRRRVR
jgi:hypothetical protein